MICLIDVDGVVCDMYPQWLRLYNEEFQANLNANDFTKYDDFWTKIVPGAGKRMEQYLAMGEELYGPKTEVIEGAHRALNRLSYAGDEIIFCTACYSGQTDAKIEWLRRKELLTPNRGLMAAVDAPKWLIRGDVLIDDRPQSVTEFISHGGIGVLFSQPWNRDEYTPGPRMESWEEIGEDGIMGFLKRKVLGVAA